VEALINEKKTTRLRIVELPRAGGPVAGQFKIRSVPTLWLYEGTERVSTSVQDIMGRLRKGS
jgi:hypothetical protein